MDEDILEEVSRHDTAFEADALLDLDGEEEAERPATADRETEVGTLESLEATLKKVCFLSSG